MSYRPRITASRSDLIELALRARRDLAEARDRLRHPARYLTEAEKRARLAEMVGEDACQLWAFSDVDLAALDWAVARIAELERQLAEMTGSAPP